jgi:hypothetical protein
MYAKDCKVAAEYIIKTYLLKLALTDEGMCKHLSNIQSLDLKTLQASIQRGLKDIIDTDYQAWITNSLTLSANRKGLSTSTDYEYYQLHEALLTYTKDKDYKAAQVYEQEILIFPVYKYFIVPSQLIQGLKTLNLLGIEEKELESELEARPCEIKYFFKCIKDCLFNTPSFFS